MYDDLQTPALIVDAATFDHNLVAMTAALPGDRLRPHVKAHKCSALARRQVDAGHRHFTAATIREIEVMAAAGLGEDLLLANEVADARRLGAAADAHGARITVAVDSEAAIAAAAAGGVREVLIDVNVGLPRCGCSPADAGRLADEARRRGLDVRGVMGYEGHVVGLADRAERVEKVGVAMELLVEAAELVGADEGVISAGGTGTFDLNTWATEIQAGSYTLMDTAYDRARHAVSSRTPRTGHRDLREQKVRGRRLRFEGLGDGPRLADHGGRKGVVLQRRAHHVRARKHRRCW